MTSPVAEDTILTSLNFPEMRYSVVFGINYLALKITLKAPLAADTRPKSLDFPGLILLFAIQPQSKYQFYLLSNLDSNC